MLEVMRSVGRLLGKKGWTLRSGGAEGADSAFERGADDARGQKEIYLPKARFFGRTDGIDASRLDQHRRALQIAEEHHPNWAALSFVARLLMARNCHQVLGEDLQAPSRFVLCWAPSPVVDQAGRVIDTRGGTGQAVRIAVANGIPVFHLGRPEHRERVIRMLSKEESCPSTSTHPGGTGTTA